jgi:glutathione synthase/RimK-type ligase-like ATP-grasp enzyme
VGEGKLLIGRLNEYSKVSKDLYRTKAAQFKKCWPEVSAYDLYDDKYLQHVFFCEQQINTPKTQYVNKSNEIQLDFPLVQKKTFGSASNNVSMAISERDVKFPAILQEFLPNNDRDLRIVVVDQNVMGFERLNRPNCFRASGSGSIRMINEIPSDCVSVARRICEKLNVITMCFDFVRDKNENWSLLEMSYTYQFDAIEKYCDFHIDQDDKIIQGCLNPAQVVVNKMLGGLRMY